MTDMIETTRIYVGGLSFAMEDKGLLDLFKDLGPIANAEVVCDRNTGKSRGYGFVTFQNPVSAAKAMKEMNGREVDGRILVVNAAEPVKSHATPGGGFTGGRGGANMGGGTIDSDPFMGYPGGNNMGYGGMGGGYMGGRFGRGDFRGRGFGRFGRGFGRGFYGGRTYGYKVLITGLAPTVDWRTLKDYLRQAGNVTFASTRNDGSGIGEFATMEDAQNACQQLDGAELLGCVISLRQMTPAEMNSDMGGFGGDFGFRRGGFGGRGRFDGGFMGRGRFGGGFGRMGRFGMPNRYQPY